MNIAKPELIAPAGDLQKLKIAFLYGADAVYASTPKFSMRTREIGFTEKSLKKGIAYAHSLGKKIYLTLNTFPHSSEIYMLGRDPNKGACAQPCRFKYKLYELEEEMREGEKYPVYEDENGTYLLNSKDLCMIEHIPELIDANIGSLKIEGRLKSIYYVAMVTRAYRKAIDLYFKNKKEYQKKKKQLKEELKKVSNRGFTTGFYFGKPNTETNNYETSRAKSDWGFIGLVKKYDNKRKVAKVEVKNHLPINSELEIVTPTNIYEYELKEMYKDGEKIDCAHADYIVEMPLDQLVPEDSFLRIKENRRRD